MELFFLLVLIVIMASALGSGFPVAFALPGAAVLTITLAGLTGYFMAGNAGAYFHTGGPWQWLSAGVTNLRSVYWVAERDTLIAVPLFIFMGIMLQKSMIAEDLLVTMARLFGPVPGGLGISVVFVGALLAATTGIVGATVVAMGLISLPAMQRNNYSVPLATGTIAASGTLGQIIPPSIVLIILADQLASATDQAGVLRKGLYKQATGDSSMPSIFEVGSTSAGEMFLGAFIPGLVLVGLYMAYILIFALLRPSAAPAIKSEGKFDAAFWREVFVTLVPPLTLIFLVLGSIITGVATVNQAGAIGAAGALVMAGYRLPENSRMRYVPAFLAVGALVMLAIVLNNFPMNIKAMSSAHDLLGIRLGMVASAALITALIWSGWRVFRIKETLSGVMLETAKTTSLVFIILMGAAMLTAAFRAFGGEDLVREFLNSLPGGFWTQFIIVMLVIFILGFFLDFIEIAVVVVPIVAPILLADPGANVTAVWFGVMIGLNIQTSFLTPPFGFALFYLRGVAPATVKTIQMYKGVIPFILLQLVALAIVGLNPPLVNYLPNRVNLLSETSPPPRNPKLQMCLDQYVEGKLQAGTQVQDAIAQAQALDLSVLPDDLAKKLGSSFSAAQDAVTGLDDAFSASEAVKAAAPAYRPVLTQVRQTEKKIRRLETKIAALKTRIERIRDEARADERAGLQARMEALQGDVEALKAQIPATWESAHSDFLELTQAETKARNMYRRNADTAYEGAQKVLDVLNANDAFAALEAPLLEIRQTIETGTPAAATDALKGLEREFGRVAGASNIKKLLSKVRRALKGKSPNIEKALAQYEKALAAYQEQQGWRTQAAARLKPGISTYLDATRDTFGMRLQPRFTREQALFMAWCSADHTDISLNF